MRSEGFCFKEKSTDTSWDRASDLPICSTAPYHCATARSLVLNVSYAISDIDHKVSYAITDINDASYTIADFVSYTVNDTDQKSLI